MLISQAEEGQKCGIAAVPVFTKKAITYYPVCLQKIYTNSQPKSR